MNSTGRPIPDYFISRKNTAVQVVFTALFAYFFINLYHPFSVSDWYDVGSWQFYLISGLLVVAGMVVIILSRFFMFWLQHRRPISRMYYGFMVAAEIILMGVLYAFLERLVLGDVRPFWELLYLAVLNTSLILLIPYLISLLFFAWREKKMNLDTLMKQLRSRPQFIPFRDENGVLRFTIKAKDVIYLEASDNYVNIFYYTREKIKSYLLRNTLKRLELSLKDYPLLRCHRSYMVNTDQVTMLRKEKGQYQLWLDDEGSKVIPVSRTYSEKVSEFFAQPEEK